MGAALDAMTGLPAPSVGCGMPLIILWAFQAMIDEGLITVAEAVDLLRQIPETGAKHG